MCSRGPTLVKYQTFQVKSVDLLLAENGKKHYTDDYQKNFVVRRGWLFALKIYHEGFDEKNHQFFFELKTGDNPRKRDGTLIEVRPSKEHQDDDYYYQITSKTDEFVNVSIFVPAHALVSSYQLNLVTEYGQYSNKERKEYPIENTLYIIFNPWNEDDEVYMEDEGLKQEYVMNDTGLIYWSGHRQKPWNFAQFTDAALKCTFKLLESEKRVMRRDTAREVARHMSAMANSCDNNGLLAGMWEDKYGNEVKPWQWAGSQAIFKKYLETGRSVKYGQCWVFSGVTTSMMRCLGIPCRSVTNYDSAHDSNGNCTNDELFDEDDNYIKFSDSVWNFHVWNDAWMARPDLPAGMGGWQAIDGTPQESSDGKYQCGPASIQAIKEGNIELPSDGRFVFAEVNADTVYWQRDNRGQFNPIRVKQNSIGSAILTKSPYAYDKEDITDQYKHKEGSVLERAVVRNVMKKVKNPVIENQPKDIKFSTKVPWNLYHDGDLTAKMSAINKKFQTLTVIATVVPHVIRYNGVMLKTLQKQTSEQVLSSRDDHSFEFKVEMDEFKEFKDEDISVRFSFFAKVKETGQVYVTQKICNIQKPEMKLELLESEDGKVKSRGEMKVRIHIPKVTGIEKFSNCFLLVESPLVEDATIQLTDSEANSYSGYVDKSFEVGVFWRDKKTAFNVTFNSAEISGVQGTMEVEVDGSIVPW